MQTPKVFDQLAKAILEGSAKKATKYLTDKLVVKATFKGKRDKRYGSQSIVFTIGTPNYAERDFIKTAEKAKEPFPIKKIQLKFDSKT